MYSNCSGSCSCCCCKSSRDDRSYKSSRDDRSYKSSRDDKSYKCNKSYSDDKSYKCCEESYKCCGASRDSKSHHVTCYKTKNGFISASLNKTVSPSFFSAVGDVITYSYTINNTGSDIICDPIMICDDQLGTQFIPRSFICPGKSQTFTRTYTIQTSDLSNQTIKNTAVAYINVSRKCCVTTCKSSATITAGNADLLGSMTQNIVLDSPEGTVEVTVTVSNSASSSTAAQNVTLTLQFPVGISNVIAGNPAPTSIGANAVSYSVPTLGVGVSSTFRFRYTAGNTTTGASYNFSGYIQSSTYDANPGNSFVSSTFVFP